MSRDRIDERTATLNRLNDRLFKFIFASEHHKDILIRFLNSVLGEDRQIEDLDYMDREFDPFLEDGKLSHFDVRARGRDGRIFHVEVQVAKEPHIFKRSLFYVMNSYVTQIRQGDSYGALHPVIFVGILNFELLEDKPQSYHSVHRLLDTETYRCYCEDIELHYLEIPKLKKLRKTPQTGLERMLSYMGGIGGAEGLKQLASRDADIERILKLEEMFVTDPQQWVGYLMRERAQTDYEHSLSEQLREAKERGLQDGLQQGLQQGLRTAREEMARNLSARGLAMDVIVETTGLSEEEIRGIVS